MDAWKKPPFYPILKAYRRLRRRRSSLTEAAAVGFATAMPGFCAGLTYLVQGRMPDSAEYRIQPNTDFMGILGVDR
jgi:hypothetical protein